MSEANRWDLMREAGVDGSRLDGSQPDRQTDHRARQGELYVGVLVGGYVHPVSDKPDAGYDVLVNGWKLGVHTSKYPVLRSHLIYHRRKQADNADLYTLVCASRTGRLCFGGWAWTPELRSAPLKALDSRFAGAPSIHTSSLRPFVELFCVIREAKVG